MVLKSNFVCVRLLKSWRDLFLLASLVLSILVLCTRAVTPKDTCHLPVLYFLLQWLENAAEKLFTFHLRKGH